MHQSDHPVRNGDGDPRRHERALTGRQLDVDRAEQIDARIAVVGAAGHRQVAIEANDRQRGGHDGHRLPLAACPTRAQPPQTVRYRERLWVPWWWWLPGLGAGRA